MKVYMMVTGDKYQLPVYIADTAKELSKICGTSTNTIYSIVSKYKHGKIKYPRFICVKI